MPTHCFDFEASATRDDAPMKCETCGSNIRHYSCFKRLRHLVPERCGWCGAAHLDGKRIGPEVVPLAPGLRYSWWHPYNTRPPRPGLYDVRYMSTEPAVLRLHWSGAGWEWQGRAVLSYPADFRGWRGSLM